MCVCGGGHGSFILGGSLICPAHLGGAGGGPQEPQSRDTPTHCFPRQMGVWGIPPAAPKALGTL